MSLVDPTSRSIVVCGSLLIMFASVIKPVIECFRNINVKIVTEYCKDMIAAVAIAILARKHFIETSTGFESMVSALALQCSTY